jgi:DNA polymerase sigma
VIIHEKIARLYIQALSSFCFVMSNGGSSYVQEQLHAIATLDRELREFVENVKLTDSEWQLQFEFMNQLIKICDAVFKSKLKIEVFGSAASGLCEKYSDVDASVMIDFSSLSLRFHGTSKFYDYRSLCSSSVVAIADYVKEQMKNSDIVVKQLIETAKVPIVVLQNGKGQTIDISINNQLPIFNTQLLSAYAKMDERVQILVLCVKRWARLMKIVGAKEGNLSSYAWTLLCIYYLQVRPQGALLVSLQKLAQSHPESLFKCPFTGKQFDIRFSKATKNLVLPCKATPSELLRGFFMFYSREFQWGLEVASIRLGTRHPKDEFHRLFMSNIATTGSKHDTIHIEDPFDLQRNLNCVLDSEGLARLRLALTDVDKRVADIPASLLLPQARQLFYARTQETPVLPTFGYYIETSLVDGKESEQKTVVDMW